MLGYESLISKFSLVLLVYNLIGGCSKKGAKNIRESAFEQTKMKAELKI